MPTPARSATASREGSPPTSSINSTAASSNRSRFFCASARISFTLPPIHYAEDIGYVVIEGRRTPLISYLEYANMYVHQPPIFSTMLLFHGGRS
ncbi:hypothetical protein CHELA40_12567 [Chelatococcus asaccharovorans]|nr:hypothetical protein CHELA40_12567 [Chelatococcus asaccharovorans]